ncbi:MAG TPA: hypothetical protein VLU43_14715 [Anaeromyxobacteraceae bacterium]|nr:hypothetical protein [Anaeromyxobacteraceae bacterium]
MRSRVLATIAFLGACWAGNAMAQCTPGTNWTVSATDSAGETTYTLSAPCKVYVGIPFDVVATVSDPTHPNTDVAWGWSIVDVALTGPVTVIVAGGGYLESLTTDASGNWQQIVTQTYTGTPVDHTIEFNFTDLGHGMGAHDWTSQVIGSLTVDPYPPAPNAPPVVSAGPDLAVSSQAAAAVVLAGSATDPDGDPLQYRWLEGSSVVQEYQPVGAAGSAPLALAALGPLSAGSHAFTLEVTDGTHVVDDTVTVTVGDSPPSISAATITARVGQRVSLTAGVADFDGDTLTYQWLEGTRLLASGAVATPAGGATVQLPPHTLFAVRLGAHVLTLIVSDGVHEVRAAVPLVVTLPRGEPRDRDWRALGWRDPGGRDRD